MEENGTNHQRRPMPKPVKWTGYESLRSEHATHLVVQSHGSELTLLFFELQPPFTTGTPEEQAAQMEQLPHVEAKCVARIVMSAPNAAQASDVLSEQLNHFKLAVQEAMRVAKTS
jgi:hypothetical protein